MSKIEKDDHAINKKHNTDTKCNNKVAISGGPGNISDSLNIVTKSVITNPHINNIQSQWQSNNGNKQEDRPKSGVSGEFERDD